MAGGRASLWEILMVMAGWTSSRPTGAETLSTNGIGSGRCDFTTAILFRMATLACWNPISNPPLANMFPAAAWKQRHGKYRHWLADIQLIGPGQKQRSRARLPAWMTAHTTSRPPG